MASSNLKEQLLGAIITFIYQILASTYRYKVFFEDESDREGFYRDMHLHTPHEKNHILAFFHQFELCLIPYFADKNIAVLVSQSKDGEMMTTALTAMGYQVVRGSSSKRAIAGFIEILKKVKEGYTTTMAVDGPRGPIYKVKEGIPKLSEKSGKEIAPVAANAHSAFKFEKSWNKALLPKPFSKIDILVGKIGSYSTEELESKMLSLNELVMKKS